MFTVVMSFYQRMMASVRLSGQVTGSFIVSNEAKECCVFAPQLFAVYFSVMMETTFENVIEGVKFQFGTSDGLFNEQDKN